MSSVDKSLKVLYCIPGRNCQPLSRRSCDGQLAMSVCYTASGCLHFATVITMSFQGKTISLHRWTHFDAFLCGVSNEFQCWKIATLATWALMVHKHRRCIRWHTAISWTCRHQLAILNQWIWCRLSARKLVVLRTKQILVATFFEPCWAPKIDDWIAVLFDKFPRINMHGKSYEQWNHQLAFHFSQKCSLFNLYSPICRQNSGLISMFQNIFVLSKHGTGQLQTRAASWDLPSVDSIASNLDGSTWATVKRNQRAVCWSG